MMASMVANSSSNLSPFPTQEKGSRNKRKFRADTPLSDSGKVVPSAANDGLSYEFSAEKFEMTTNHGEPPSLCDFCGVYQDHSDNLKLDLGLSCSTMMGSSEVGPSYLREEVEANEFQDADWSDLSESQLEELMLSNLDAIFKSAIKKIVACGYTEEDATKAVLRAGHLSGTMDIVSNVVDNALEFLRNGQDVDASMEHCFEDLQQLERYVLAELVCSLREVGHFFSTGDAMWHLLICDMNASHACTMDGDPLSSMITEGSSSVTSPSPSRPQFKAGSKAAEISLSKPYKALPTAPCAPVTQSDTNLIAGVPNFAQPKNSLVLSGLTSEREGSISLSSNPVDKPFSAVGISQTSANEEKFVSSRKIHSNSSKYTLRQKSLHLDKSHRAHGTKGSSRAAKFSGFVLDKKFKTMSDSVGLNLKNASLKLSKAMGMGMELAHETGSVSSSASSALSPIFNAETSATTTLMKTGHVPASSATPMIKTQIMSTADTELSLSLATKSNPQQVSVSCDGGVSSAAFAGTSYSKSLAQWAPHDKKDEMIVKLVPRIRELQSQLQEWTEWANKKVMQAARRLGKDKAELKTLRQEKEEVERLKKEKQTLEENTLKKLSEMENALSKASGQVERANAAVRRLEVENAALRREMEAAKLHAAESAASFREVSTREKKTLMKVQSWEKQKSMFQEELVGERRKLSQLRQELEQAKDLHSQLEARWRQEEKAKVELLTQANSIRKEREHLEASAKLKEDTIKSKAEANLQKYKEDIEKLEKEISQLRLKTDSSKIAALKRGIDGSYASRLADSETSPASKESRDSLSRVAIGYVDLSGSGGVKRERECVMCLSEEMSVVFLPCAHQVVCKMCNELHEKQGMNDCPSCRSPIQRRICVRYARP